MMNVIMQLPKQLQDQDIAFSYWMKEAPDDKFLVTAFAVDEAIFGMTKIEVMLSSKDDNIDLQALMDSSGTLTVHHKYLSTPRHFSGIVVEAERGDRGHHRTAYRLVLMPSLFRLDYGSDCRIFQQKKVTDIVKDIFSEHGIENVTWGVDEGKHEMREYCVQYRESHLAFVERILAEEGIFYYFEHDKQGQLKLVITDSPNVLHDCPDFKAIEYNALSSGAVKGVFCSSLNYREKLRSTTMVQRDYTFRNPEYSQEHKEKTSTPNGEKKDYELYDYPGRYKKDAAGKPFTRYKLEATRVDASLGYGISNAPHLITGHAITLEEHPDDKLNQKWRLLTIRHEGVQPQAWGEDGQGNALIDSGIVAPGLNGTQLSGLAFGTTSSQSPNLLNQAFNRRLNLSMQSTTDNQDVLSATLYANAFTVQASTLPYRPPQTVKPLIDGPQIAIVVGPPGEEIFTDQYGRVKVHFPWDRHKDPKAEDSSCWIRVSQIWGGGKYGGMVLPRIGHEVIVDFLEGDPDQPIIIGRTYHEKNKPAYNLPEDKTKMVIRSDTHKNEKGKIGFNELSFEDDKGREEVFIHAERDMNLETENNHTEWVGKDKGTHIAGHQYTEVNQARHEKIALSIVTENGGDRIDYIGKINPLSAFTNKYHIKADEIINKYRLPNLTGMGNWQTFVSGNHLSNVNMNSVETVNGNKSIFSKSNSTISAEGIINISSGKDTIIKSNDMTIIECGESAIVLKGNGEIFLVGTKIYLSSNEVDIFGESNIKINSKKININ